MPAIIVETFESGGATVGPDSPGVDLKFAVLGTEIDIEVRNIEEAAHGQRTIMRQAIGELPAAEEHPPQVTQIAGKVAHRQQVAFTGNHHLVLRLRQCL